MNYLEMNKFDKDVLHSLIDIMAEDKSDRLEFQYYSPVGDTYPVKMEKKKITIKIEDL